MFSLTRKSDRLAAIDGLRGYCITAVVLHHVFVYLNEFYKDTAIAAVASNFRFGVQMFFVLSAFLLYRQMNTRKSDPNESYKTFYLRRFFRTYPLWVAVSLYYFFDGGPLAALIENISFMFGFNHFLQIPQSWSLFIEEVFYLTFPVLFLLVNSFRRSVVFVVISFVVSVLWKKYAVSLGVHDYGNFVAFSPLANYQYFALGSLAFFIFQSEKLQAKKWIYVANFWLLLTLAVAATNYFSDFAEVLIFGIMLGVLVQGSVVNFLCTHRWIRVVGVLCYSIYLTHMVVLGKLYSLAAERDSFLQFMFSSGSALQFVGAGAFVLIICALVAAVTFFVIEYPFVKVGRILISNKNSH